MLTHMAGTDCERKVGEVIEVGDAEAGRLVTAGFAALVKVADATEPPTDPKPGAPRKSREGGAE